MEVLGNPGFDISNNYFQCLECNETFRLPAQFSEHMQFHMEPQFLACIEYTEDSKAVEYRNTRNKPITEMNTVIPFSDSTPEYQGIPFSNSTESTFRGDGKPLAQPSDMLTFSGTCQVLPVEDPKETLECADKLAFKVEVDEGTYDKALQHTVFANHLAEVPEYQRISFSEIPESTFGENVKPLVQTSDILAVSETCQVLPVEESKETFECADKLEFKAEVDEGTYDKVPNHTEFVNHLDEVPENQTISFSKSPEGTFRDDAKPQPVEDPREMLECAAKLEFKVEVEEGTHDKAPNHTVFVNHLDEVPEYQRLSLSEIPESTFKENVKPLVQDVLDCTDKLGPKVDLDELQDTETIDAIPYSKIKKLSIQKQDRYKCQQCGKKFNRSGALSTHIKTHSSVRLFHCAECGKSFKRSDHLNQHFRSHENTNPLNCPECGKRFKHSGAVVSHMRSHIVIGHYVCMDCNREFKLYRYLVLHMQGHIQPEFIECGQFDKVDPRYFNEDYMNHHVKREKFVCEECGKRFKNPGALRMHMTVHTSDRPFECNLCAKTFKDMPHLDQHMQVHTKCESLVCVECGKTFKNPRILATHIKIHSTDRPFECAGCGKTFKRSDHLTQHMRIHADEQRHVCAECGSTFEVPELLFIHMFNSHSGQSGTPGTSLESVPRPVPTEEAGNGCAEKEQTANLSEQFIQHMQLVGKRFECVDCGESFPQRVALDKHRKVHNKRELLECGECGKSFKHLGALNTHMKFHAKSRPFQCTECKKSFIIPNHLTRHMQAHITRQLNKQAASTEQASVMKEEAQELLGEHDSDGEAAILP